MIDGERLRIYLATSWRNTLQPSVVQALTTAGYEVYDFRNPNGEKGFAWSDSHVCQPGCEVNAHLAWDHNDSSPELFVHALLTPEAKRGFDRDYQAMQMADIFVCLLPCERDAHMELGWATAAGKETYVVLDNPCKATLMYQLVDHVCVNLPELYATLGATNG